MTKYVFKDPSSANLLEMVNTCVMMRTRLVARAVSALYDDKLRHLGLNASQCSLLVVIFGLGPSRRAQIGRFNRLDRSTLSRNLQIMLGNGWIEELDSEEADGRGKPIAVTTAGKALLTEAYPAWRAAQGEAKAMLGSQGAALLAGIGDGITGFSARA